MNTVAEVLPSVSLYAPASRTSSKVRLSTPPPPPWKTGEQFEIATPLGCREPGLTP